MKAIPKALTHPARSRAGLTLIEVMIALGVFLVGAVSVAALFVTATGLHTEAIRRRTASFIAQQLLADLQTQPMRQIFARTQLDGAITDSDAFIDVDGTAPGIDDQDPTFNLWPLPADQDVNRNSGPLLINREWIWYENRTISPPEFRDCDRGMWHSYADPHDDEDVVLQPRTWIYVVADQDPGGTNHDMEADAPGVTVDGDPIAHPPGQEPGTPGYVVIDEEWIRYIGTNGSAFTWPDPNNASLPLEGARGQGETEATAHRMGTPVTVAREHSDYSGYYYTVQYYPLNPSVSRAKVIVSVAYGTATQLQRAYFFHTTYTPTQY